MKKALIVEDLPPQALRQERSLRKLGFNVVDKNDGSYVWETHTDLKIRYEVERNAMSPVDMIKENQYDLLVLDLRLNGERGENILERIKSLKGMEKYSYLNDMCVIVSTTVNKRSDVLDICRNYSPNAYLVKSDYTDSAFESKVQRLFEKNADLEKIKIDEIIDIREDSTVLAQGNTIFLPEIVGTKTAEDLEKKLKDLNFGEVVTLDFSDVDEINDAGLKAAYVAKDQYKAVLDNFSKQAEQAIRKAGYEYLLD